jgi:hypothetical protein
MVLWDSFFSVFVGTYKVMGNEIIETKINNNILTKIIGE